MGYQKIPRPVLTQDVRSDQEKSSLGGSVVDYLLVHDDPADDYTVPTPDGNYNPFPLSAVQRDRTEGKVTSSLADGQMIFSEAGTWDFDVTAQFSIGSDNTRMMIALEEQASGEGSWTLIPSCKWFTVGVDSSAGLTGKGFFTVTAGHKVRLTIRRLSGSGVSTTKGSNVTQFKATQVIT